MNFAFEGICSTENRQPDGYLWCFLTSFHFFGVPLLHIQAQQGTEVLELPQRRSAYAVMQARGQIYLNDEATA